MANRSADQDLVLSDLLGIARRSWLAITLLTLVGGASGLAVAYLLRPIYRAQVLLFPAATQSTNSSTLSRLAEQFAPLAGAVGSLAGGSGSSSKEVWLATLNSRYIAEEFIRQHEMMPLLFPNRWEPALHQWKVRNGKPWAPTMDEAVKEFDDIRSVREDRRTGLVTLTMEWHDPALVALWSNDLVTRVNEFLRAKAIEEARKSITFLDGELAKTTVVERQQIIYRLIESKTADIMMANARKEYAFLVVDPAVVPDAKNFVRPRRIIISVIGAIIGLMLGLSWAMFRSSSKRKPSDPVS